MKKITEHKIPCAIVQQGCQFLICEKTSGEEETSQWEFPNYEVNPTETYEQCLVREMKDNFNLEIQIEQPLTRRVYKTNKDTRLKIIPFVCHIKAGDLIAKNYARAIWVEAFELKSYNWNAQQVALIENITAPDDNQVLKNTFEHLIKFWPLWSVCLLVFCIFRGWFYHFPFDIQIYQYVSVDEVLTLWLTQSLWSAGSLLVVILYSRIIFLLKPGDDDYLTFKLLPYIVFIALNGYIAYAWFSIFFRDDAVKEFGLLLLFALIVALFCVLFFLVRVGVFIRHKAQKKKWERILNNTMTFCVVISLLVSTLILTVYDSLTEEFEKKPIQRYSLNFKGGETIETNDELWYIGRTKNHLFLYDSCKKEPTIYNAAELKSLKIHK